MLNLIKILHVGEIAKFLSFISSQPLAFGTRKEEKRKGRAVTGLISNRITENFVVLNIHLLKIKLI